MNPQPAFSVEKYKPSDPVASLNKFNDYTVANFTSDASKTAPEPPPMLRLVSAASLSKRPPERFFLVPEYIPGRNVTLLSGDGGTGKSLLALMLGVSVAASKPWLGIEVAQGPVVYVSAEDELEEVHRRLAAICEADGLDVIDLDGLSIIPLAGENSLMAVQSHAGALAPTPLWHEFAAKIVDVAPALVVLDTSADFFGGNEISRSEVRQFVAMLRGLALKADCAFLLLSHPSVAGMNTGTGLSGSTAWNNSVRSRLYLRRPAASNGEPVDPDIRALQTMKSNYGRAGGEIRLRWLEGRFVNETAATPIGFDALAIKAKAERVFLDLLQQFTGQGRNVSANLGPTYAPARFAAHSDAQGVSKHAFEAAMNKHLKANQIRNESFGPPSKTRYRLVFVAPEGEA